LRALAAKDDRFVYPFSVPGRLFLFFQTRHDGDFLRSNRRHARCLAIMRTLDGGASGHQWNQTRPCGYVRYVQSLWLVGFMELSVSQIAGVFGNRALEVFGEKVFGKLNSLRSRRQTNKGERRVRE